MKYLIYLRVSTKDQDEEMQLDHCLKFIKQRGDVNFQYEVYRDKITSKKPLFKVIKNRDKTEIITIPRPGAKAMVDRINKGDIVIAMRLDRLCRKSSETSRLIDKLDELQAEILLVTQPGIKNKILLGVYAGMAEEEVKTLRSRVKEKLESKKMRNERYSRFLPYGYGLHETKLVPIKVGDEIVMKRGVLVPIYEEQEVLTRMSQLSDEGMSHQTIAKALTQLGYRNREGKPFQKMSIYRILSRIKQTRSSDQLLKEKVALASH